MVLDIRVMTGRQVTFHGLTVVTWVCSVGETLLICVPSHVIQFFTKNE